MANVSSTADEILRCARSLIIGGGYNGFSYADISGVVGIRKASIHHHFPSKIDLVRAVLQRHDEEAAAGEAASRGSSPVTTDRACWSEHTGSGASRRERSRKDAGAQRNGHGQKSPDGRSQGRSQYQRRASFRPPVFPPPATGGVLFDNGQTGNGAWRG